MTYSVLHKEHLLKLLDYFVAVCAKYNLKYYLAGGSVIGAVRHKGFIPWDDDVDVYMPRADYEKIQMLPDSVWGGDMRLASWRKTPNYRYDFIKIELTNTTLIERFNPDYVGGVFLDIFPLDMVSDDAHIREKQLNCVRKIQNEYIMSYIQTDSDCESVFQLFKLKLVRLKNRRPTILDEWEEEVSAFNNCKHLIVDFHSPWMHRPMPIEFIGEGVEMEFEGKKYIVPSDYDSYLKHIYGDYTQLPPVEKRVGHSFEYVNYDKRIKESEISKIFALIHKKYSYNVSLKTEIKNLFKLFKF